jgi:hypothetical protein
MKINLTKLLEYSTFTNKSDTDAAYTLPPWWMVRDLTAQNSAYSFEIEEANHDS